MRTRRRVPAKLLASLVLALALAAVVSSVAPATAGSPAKGEKVVYFDMYYQGQVKPGRIFLTANSGPFTKKLRWRNWGSNKTVGRGRFISNCASCGEYENKPAVWTLSGLVECKAEGVWTYLRARLEVKDPERKRVETYPAGCPDRR